MKIGHRRAQPLGLAARAETFEKALRTPGVVERAVAIADLASEPSVAGPREGELVLGAHRLEQSHAGLEVTGSEGQVFAALSELDLSEKAAGGRRKKPHSARFDDRQTLVQGHPRSGQLSGPPQRLAKVERVPLALGKSHGANDRHHLCEDLRGLRSLPHTALHQRATALGKQVVGR